MSKKTQHQVDEELRVEANIQRQVEYQVRVDKVKAEIDKLLEENQLALVTRMHYTETGIMPVMNMIDTKKDNPVVLPEPEGLTP